MEMIALAGIVRDLLVDDAIEHGLALRFGSAVPLDADFAGANLIEELPLSIEQNIEGAALLTQGLALCLEFRACCGCLGLQRIFGSGERLELILRGRWRRGEG